MELWRRILTVMGGGAVSRQKGLQTADPSYSNRAAVPVTTDGALQLSAVWACVKLITESVASLPINIYKKDVMTGTRVLWPDHPLAVLFGGKVNRWQTRIEFLETVLYQQVLLGNAYSAIQRGAGKRIIGLVPLMTPQMQVALSDTGAVIYTYTDGVNVNAYSQDSIWHSKQFGNGIIGLCTLGYARNSVGVGIAAEDSVTKIYNNGGKPSGVLTIDHLLKDDQRAKVRENFKDLSEGESSRLFVLEAGMKYQQVSLSPQDIELLASRKFQIEEIARFFGVPSVLINDTTAGTTWGSGIQEIVTGFFKFGLRPYLNRMQESMKCWLLTPEERLSVDIEFDPSQLLQPGLSDRIKTYKEAVQGGIMAANEARAEEGWNPKDGGDDLLVQRQMVALKDLGNVKDGAVTNVAQTQN